MLKTIPAISYGDTFGNTNVEIELPSKCPHCQVAYADQPMISYLITSENFFDAEEQNLYSLYFCPHCEQCFFLCYDIFDSSCGDLHGEIREILPHPEACTKFPDKISTLSPQFVKIYSQAEKA